MLNKITELSISISNIFIIKQQSVMPHSIKKKTGQKWSSYFKTHKHANTSYLPVHKTLESKVLRFNFFQNK